MNLRALRGVVTTMYQIITPSKYLILDTGAEGKEPGITSARSRRLTRYAVWDAGRERWQQTAFQAERKACAKAQSMRSGAGLWNINCGQFNWGTETWWNGHQTLLETRAGSTPVGWLRSNEKSWSSSWKVVRDCRALDTQHRGQKLSIDESKVYGHRRTAWWFERAQQGSWLGILGDVTNLLHFFHEGVGVVGVISHFSIPVCYLFHSHLEENIHVFQKDFVLTWSFQLR